MADEVKRSFDLLEAGTARVKSLYLGGDPVGDRSAGTLIDNSVLDELNTINGLTATAVELNAVADGVLAGATIALETAGTGSQVVNVQLTDAAGSALAHSAVVQCFFSDAATGLGITGTGPTTVSIESGGAGALLAPLSGATTEVYLLQTNATGAANIEVADSGSGTDWFLVIVLPNGKQIVSDAIIPTPAG